MANSDRVLIDPAPEALERALAEAAEAANGAARERLLEWPPLNLRARLGAPEGWQQWNGCTGAGHSGQARSVVAVAWWADRAGRRHHRVVGRRGQFNNAARANVLTPGEKRPPLWMVYSEHLYAVGSGLFAVCACGAAGTTEELGWMGPCCGPCHDRRESGDMTPRERQGPATTIFPGRNAPGARVAFSPDGVYLRTYAGLEQGLFRCWDLGTGELQEWQAPSDYFSDYDVTFAPSGPMALTISVGEFVLIDLARGRMQILVDAHGEVQVPSAGAISPDGSAIAFVCGNPPELVLWDVAAQARRATFPGAMAQTRLLVFSADGKMLATSARQQVRQWDLVAGRERPVLHRSAQEALSLAFSPDGAWLAAGLNGGNVQTWDATTGAHLHLLPALASGRPSVAFSPDGAVLATIGVDGTLRLWDVASGRPRGAFGWHCGGVLGLAFSPAGGWLATIAADDTTKLWPWPLMLGP